MGLHAYCLVPAGHFLPADCEGLEGVGVSSVRAGSIEIRVTEHAAPPAASADAVRVHDRVVRAAMTRDVTPVPVRFGQWFPAPEIAAERVAEDAGRWEAHLERFAGRAEYGVRVLWRGQGTERDVHAAAMESGTEYMAALARKQARATGRRENADRVHAGISSRAGALIAEERVEHGQTGDLVLSLAHLVAWSDADAYHASLEAEREAWPQATLVLTGPWPPYSFVE